MSDIIQLISSEGSAAVDQVIRDSARLHIVVNGSGTDSATTEDGSAIPSIRKALLENLYFKTPILPWSAGTQSREYNQLYSFTKTGITSWWYAPGATNTTPVTLPPDPTADTRWRVFIDSGNLDNIYARINSPLFTGNPRAPTPAQGDSSNSIATTEWAQEEIREAIEASAIDWSDITIGDLEVTGKAKIKDLEVTGTITLPDQDINSPTSTGTFNKIYLDGSDAILQFTDPAAGARRTTLTPTRVTSVIGSFRDGTFDNITVNAEGATGSNLRVHGASRMDTLVLSKNSGQAAGLDTLNVSGVTRVENLIITGEVQGLDIDLEGKDINPRNVTAQQVNSKALQVTETVTFGEDSNTFLMGQVNILGTVTGLPSALEGAELTLGDTTVDDLVVRGTLYAEIDQSDQDVVTRSLTTDTLVVNTTINSPDADAVLQDVSAKTFYVIPEQVTITSGVYAPSGLSNMYLVSVTQDVRIDSPAGLLQGGKAASIVLYLYQDAIGGRLITFSSEFKPLNEGEINTDPNGVTVVQLMYPGSGSEIDTLILPRV